MFLKTAVVFLQTAMVFVETAAMFSEGSRVKSSLQSIAERFIHNCIDKWEGWHDSRTLCRSNGQECIML